MFYIIVLIHAFQNEIWKGFVGLLCGLYMLYYAATEFEHEKKSQILPGWVICIIGSILFRVLANI